MVLFSAAQKPFRLGPTLDPRQKKDRSEFIVASEKGTAMWALSLHKRAPAISVTQITDHGAEGGKHDNLSPYIQVMNYFSDSVFCCCSLKVLLLNKHNEISGLNAICLKNSNEQRNLTQMEQVCFVPLTVTPLCWTIIFTSSCEQIGLALCFSWCTLALRKLDFSLEIQKLMFLIHYLN